MDGAKYSCVLISLACAGALMVGSRLCGGPGLILFSLGIDMLRSKTPTQTMDGEPLTAPPMSTTIDMLRSKTPTQTMDGEPLTAPPMSTTTSPMSTATPCIHFAHETQTRNTGDLMSTPYHYLSRFGINACTERPDSVRAARTSNAILIYGGGGLLAPSFKESNTHLFETYPGSIIVWGIGFNSEDSRQVLPPYLLNAPRVKMLGIRDRLTPIFLSSIVNATYAVRHVPCVSAMHPHFDRFFMGDFIPALPPATRSILYVRHLHPRGRKGCEESNAFPVWRKSGLLKERDVITNTGPIERILDALAESEAVVTNSYHAIYWATLLGRKVILCSPWTSKFRNLRWPVQAYSGDLLSDVRNAPTYPTAMKEARAANVAFADEVKQFI